MEQIMERQIAHIIDIGDILKSRYTKEVGWTPNYITTAAGRKVSRVNLLGVIVEKRENTAAVDDGTGKILVRVFEDSRLLESCSIGEITLIIGKIRQFNEERYIVPEIIRKLEDKRWADVRKLELGKLMQKVSVPAAIIKLVKELDTGQGADMEQVIAKCCMDGAEEAVQKLMASGDIFQVKPGLLKATD